MCLFIQHISTEPQNIRFHSLFQTMKHETSNALEALVHQECRKPLIMCKKTNRVLSDFPDEQNAKENFS